MTAEAPPTGRRGKQPPPACTFCGRPREDVRFFTASSSGAAICDECVQLIAKVMGEGLSQDERMSVDAPHYLFPDSVVARLWAAAAAVADTVRMSEGWRPAGHEPAQQKSPSAAREHLPEQLWEVVQAARQLASYYAVPEDITQ